MSAATLGDYIKYVFLIAGNERYMRWTKLRISVLDWELNMAAIHRC